MTESIIIQSEDFRIGSPEFGSENQLKSQRSERSLINELVYGKATLTLELTYMWGVFMALVGLCIFAQIVFPTDYSVFQNMISEQGSILLNPAGGLIWNIGVIINGILHIPHINYLENQLKSIHPKQAKYMKWAGVSAAIGFTFVGIFCMDYTFPHYVSAVIAFIGYYVAAMFSFNILKLSKNNLPKEKRGILVYKWYFILSGAICLVLFIFDAPIMGLYLTPIFEWNYLLAICSWLLLTPKLIKKYA